jgi:hypothetical protein
MLAIIQWSFRGMIPIMDGAADESASYGRVIPDDDAVTDGESCIEEDGKSV